MSMTDSQEEEFLAALYKGGEFLSAGKVVDARTLLERANALQPKNEKAQNLLGLTYFKLGLFDRASQVYEGLVNENPVDPTLRVNLGLVYLKANNLERCIKEFEAATDLDPEHKKAHNYLGLALAQAGDYGKARGHFVLAGSPTMAEKMERAMANQLVRPAAAPSPSEPPTPPEPPPSEPPPAVAVETVEALPPTEDQQSLAESWGDQFQESPAVAPITVKLGEETEMPVIEAAVEVPAPIAEPPSPQEAWARAESADESVAAPVEEDWGFTEQAPIQSSPTQVAWPSTVAPAEDDWGHLTETASAVEAEPQTREQAEVTHEAIAVVEPSGLATQDAPAESSAATPEAPPAMWETTSEPATSWEQPVVETTAPPEETSATWEPELQTPEAWASTPPEQLQTAPDTAAEESAEWSNEPQAESPPAEPVEPTWVAQPVSQAFAPAPPGSGSQAGVRAPAGYAALEAQRLVDLGATKTVLPEASAGVFHVGPDGLAITVQGEVLTRMGGLVAMVGGLSATPETRRSRGRATEHPFGTGANQLQRVTGFGTLLLEGGRRFAALDLNDDEGTYVREERLFAFEEPLAFENGRLSGDGGLSLDLVTLKGQGRVLLQLDGGLKVIPVPPGSPMVTPLARVVGWFGHVTPRLMAFAGQNMVELTGEGHALLAT